MQLTLTEAQTELLLPMLKNDLDSLMDELAKTENREWRAEMKKDEDTLRGIIEMLEKQAA